MTATQERDSAVEQAPSRRPARATVILLSVIAAAALVIALAVGYLWGWRSNASGPRYPTADSVDAGFARDMISHHQQAITMASDALTHSTDPGIQVLAYDILTSQDEQIGEMNGWLAEWGVPQNSGTPMSWMSGMDMSPGKHGAVMPGMATSAQMTELAGARGEKLDVLFLQLMIRHHQGALPMAQYEVAHGSVAAERRLAHNMVVTQSREITQMTRTLEQLGGKPLPPPS